MIFQEQYAEHVQKLVEKSGHDILLVARREPARDMNYTGYYFSFSAEKIASAAADMLEKLLAGEKDIPSVTVEIELCCNHNKIQRKVEK